MSFLHDLNQEVNNIYIFKKFEKKLRSIYMKLFLIIRILKYFLSFILLIQKKKQKTKQ